MYVLWLNSAENIIVRVLKIVVRAITNHIRNNADKLTTMLIYYYFDSISFFFIWYNTSHIIQCQSRKNIVSGNLITY